MIKNYLRVAFRNLFKNKSYVLINMFGLGIALACCITSYILVAYNIEFDNFHDDEKVENIYRLHSHALVNGSDIRIGAKAPVVVGPMAAKDFAGIKRFMRYAGNAGIGGTASYVNEQSDAINSFAENVVFADSTLFEMFDFPLVSGSHQAFKDLNSVFLDEERALKYFGDVDPIGKVLTLGFARGVEKKVVVGGVLKKVPVNSSIYLPFVMRMEHFEEMRAMDMGPWRDWNAPSVFFELENPDQAESLGKLFDKFIPLRNEAFTEQVVEKYTVEPFKSVIDNNIQDWSYINTPIPIEPLIVFVVLGLMILLIACFNLTNTSIALTATRLKEIGVRKSLGAQKRQIISQFMIETFMVIILSLIVGYVISLIIVPEFVTMWELPYTMEDLNGMNLIFMLLILVFFAALLAGIYPAFFSTKFNAVNLLKGTVKVKGTNVLTRSLVTVQFAISIIVLIAGVVFILNSKYQETIDFGYDKEQLFVIDISSEQQYTTMLAKGRTNPLIKSIGVTEHHLGYSTYKNPITYENVDYEVSFIETGKNYFETIEFDFVDGRAIDYESQSDFDNAIVVSKQFLKTVGIQGNPIGKFVTRLDKKRRIVGVVDDFVDNLYGSKEPEPFVFYATQPERWRTMIIRADQEDVKEASTFMENAWKEMFPTKPYQSRFQEDIVMAGTQQTNRNLKKIFLFLTILGGMLSASGIYSLASLNIAKRTKEIGIRKALGASVGNVVLLLNREFMIILGVAGLLGSLGGYFGTDWLLELVSAYHIPMSVFPVILSAVLIIVVGLSTTSATIFKAAKANPVDTLRDE